MRVSCERCATEYDFDPTLIAKGGTRVRCTNCAHVFKIVVPESEDAAWTVRTQDGEVYEVSSIGELKARIASRELSPDDEIRRGTEPWKSLGEIAELAPHFEAALGGLAARNTPSSLPPVAPARAADSPKATLIGVGLSSEPPRGARDAAPADFARRTLPDPILPSVASPPPRAEPSGARTEGAGPATLPPHAEPPRGSAATLPPHAEPPRGSAATLPPHAEPPRGSAPTPHPGDAAPPAPPLPSEAAAERPAAVAWHEAPPAKDEPYVYRPSEPPPESDRSPRLRLDSEPPRRPPMRARRRVPLGVILPVLVGVGFGVGVGLRDRLPEPVRGALASLHPSFADGDEAAAPPSGADGSAIEESAPAPAAGEESAQPAEEAEGGATAPEPSAAPAAEDPAAEDPATEDAAPKRAAAPARAAPAAAEEPEPTASYDALVRRAERALVRGRVSAARRDFERALELRPGAPEALTGLGYVALDGGAASAAAQRFRQAAKASFADAYIGLGEAYRALGRDADALAAYERYLQRWPNGSAASVARAQVRALRASPPPGPDEEDEVTD